MSIIHPVTNDNLDRLADRVEAALAAGKPVHLAKQLAHDELWELNPGDIVIIDNVSEVIP